MRDASCSCLHSVRNARAVPGTVRALPLCRGTAQENRRAHHLSAGSVFHRELGASAPGRARAGRAADVPARGSPHAHDGHRRHRTHRRRGAHATPRRRPRNRDRGSRAGKSQGGGTGHFEMSGQAGDARRSAARRGRTDIHRVRPLDDAASLFREMYEGLAAGRMGPVGPPAERARGTISVEEALAPLLA